MSFLRLPGAGNEALGSAWTSSSVAVSSSAEVRSPLMRWCRWTSAAVSALETATSAADDERLQSLRSLPTSIRTQGDAVRRIGKRRRRALPDGGRLPAPHPRSSGAVRRRHRRGSSIRTSCCSAPAKAWTGIGSDRDGIGGNPDRQGDMWNGRWAGRIRADREDHCSPDEWATRLRRASRRNSGSDSAERGWYKTTDGWCSMGAGSQGANLSTGSSGPPQWTRRIESEYSVVRWDFWWEGLEIPLSGGDSPTYRVGAGSLATKTAAFHGRILDASNREWIAGQAMVAVRGSRSLPRTLRASTLSSSRSAALYRV